MLQSIVWTPALDQVLQQGRAAGATWDALAAHLAVSRNVIIARAAKLGIPRLRMVPSRVLRTPSPLDTDPDRAPLPAGHPISWDAINADTQLAGDPYPLPVFV